MKNFYQKYKNEILTLLSVILPITAVYISNFFIKNNYLNLFFSNIKNYLPYIILLISIFYIIILKKQLIKNKTFIEFPEDIKYRFRNVLELTHDTYYLLCLSSEGFQKNLIPKDYFEKRKLKNLKILLLHPDSTHFKERIKEVRPDHYCDYLVKSKKDHIKNLFNEFKSLPKQTIENMEIRFYDSYPIWLLQFFNNKNKEYISEKPDSLVLTFHPRGKHSDESSEYLLSKDNSLLFDSFMIYFEKLWEESIPISPNGRVPKLVTEVKFN